MRKIKKAMTTFLLCSILIGTQWMNVSAAESGENESEGTGIGEINYDIEQGGTQNFVIEDEDGEKSELVIEEMPETARTLNKTYKITRTKTRAWTAGFYVKVSPSKITKVYDKFYKAILGKIDNARLTKESESEGRLAFLYTLDGHKKTSGVKVKILNKKLIATIF